MEEGFGAPEYLARSMPMIGGSKDKKMTTAMT
jgi:hypothetical protein